MPLPATNRSIDLCLGVSLILGAAAGLYRVSRGTVEADFSIAGVALQGLVGLLILRRSPVRAGPGLLPTLLSLPSVIAPALLFVAPGESLRLWPALAYGLAGLGLVLASAAYLTLGRSFAVLPVARPLVEHGVYRLVRHPAYLGQLLLWTGCLLLHLSAWTAALTLVAWAGTVLRLLLEERAMEDETYRCYRKRVRFRLLPGIW